MVTYVVKPDRSNYITIYEGEVALDNVTITGGSITGIIDLAIADGGTGASTALAAMQNLVNDTTFTAVTAATDDKVLIQDTSDSDNIKTVTVAGIAALASPTIIQVDGAAVSTSVPTLDFDGTDFTLSESPTDDFDITINTERIQDIVGAMVTGNTETLITVTYEDSDGTLDFVVNEASINHDNLAGFVANEHIDWTAATQNFLTTGTVNIGSSDVMTVNGSVVTGNLQVNSDTIAVTEIHSHNATAANGGVAYFARSRGSTASPTIVSSGDTLGTISAVGYDGTDYAISSRIDFTVGTTPGANDMPGNILFKVSPDGSQTPATAMTINYDKNIDITNGLDITGDLTLTGTITSASAATVATDDKVLIKDTSASDVLRTVTTQAIANLYATAATTSASGIAELATNAETLTGTDTTRIVTPDDLAYARPFVYSLARRSTNQTISTSTQTLVQLDVADEDNLSDWDVTTNYRWTPSISGKYFIVGSARFTNTASGSYQLNIFKNGANVASTIVPLFNADVPTDSVFTIVSMNGTTDYVDLRVFQTSGGNLDLIGSSARYTSLGGFLIART